MNSNLACVILVVVACTVPSIVLSWGEIDGGLVSTSRIVAKMCLNTNLNDTIAQEFWDCYKVAPGIEIFEKCQLKVNGYILNTAENLRKTCKSLYTFPRYAYCLKTEFNAAGIDMSSTLDLVNKCEAEVLGIE